MAQTPVSNPYLLVQQITDQYIRKNFENLQAYFNTQNQLLDFKFFEQVFTSAITGALIAHGLPYIPLDIIVTKITGTGTVTFKYGSFTTSNMVVDVTGPCRIRFYVGTYSRYQSLITAATSDTQTFSATPGSGGGTASPLTTKGDLYGFSTANARIPAGTNGQYLQADSTQALGVKWNSLVVPIVPLTTKGDLLGFNTANARIPVGSNGTVLTADSTQPLGVKWNTPGVSGGGGGVALQWYLPDSGGAAEGYDASGFIRSLEFSNVSSALVFALISVPSTYTAGAQIFLKGGKFSTTVTVGQALFRVTSTLIQSGTTVFTSPYVNQYVSTNAAVTVSATPSMISNVGNIDITDSSGNINGVSVAAFDTILIQLTRLFTFESPIAAASVFLLRDSLIPTGI